jgi:hypothetical protein
MIRISKRYGLVYGTLLLLSDHRSLELSTMNNRNSKFHLPAPTTITLIPEPLLVFVEAILPPRSLGDADTHNATFLLYPKLTYISISFI